VDAEGGRQLADPGSVSIAADRVIDLLMVQSPLDLPSGSKIDFYMAFRDR
jgi:hypothetical protein